MNDAAMYLPSDFSGLLPILPELMLVGFGLILLMVGVYGNRQGGNRFMLYVILAFAVVFGMMIKLSGGQQELFGGMFISDAFTRLMKELVVVAAILTLTLSLSYFQGEEEPKFEYGILAMFATAGMMLMVSAGNFLSLYMGLELQSLSLYVLAAFQRDNLRASEAGLKYFVLGAIASGMLLFGVSLIYGFTGSTDFSVLSGHFASTPEIPLGVIIGMVLVIIALAFKVSAVPFHMWTPDVYEGVPTPVTAFFAAAPKLAALALFARVLMEPFGELTAQWQQVIMLLSVASMLLGAFAAIRQENIKRLLAYSSIGHVGYALIGLATGTAAGTSGLIIYLAIYMVMSVGTFACVLLMRRKGVWVEDISDLAGLARTAPKMALALAILMFSMAGIPPLAGFFGKMYIFLAAVESGLIGLAVIGVLSSVVAAYYYLRVVKVMYFDEAAEPFDVDVAPEMRLVVGVTTLFVLGFFLYPTPLVAIAENAAQALVN